MIKFEPLKPEHFEMIHKWFNKPHVQAFYSLREWTLDEVQKKLSPYLEGNIHGHLIVADKPIGYIQHYPVKDYPWNDQELDKQTQNTAAGLDLFIGDKNYIGKGHGKKIINEYLDQIIWPKYEYCVVDPDIHNAGSIKLFQSCGFKFHKEIESTNALKKKTTLSLYIRSKPSKT